LKFSELFSFNNDFLLFKNISVFFIIGKKELVNSKVFLMAKIFSYIENFISVEMLFLIKLKEDILFPVFSINKFISKLFIML
jgi:hypothetical protein